MCNLLKYLELTIQIQYTLVYYVSCIRVVIVLPRLIHRIKESNTIEILHDDALVFLTVRRDLSKMCR